jgi:hypothetical protein
VIKNGSAKLFKAGVIDFLFKGFTGSYMTEKSSFNLTPKQYLASIVVVN